MISGDGPPRTGSDSLRAFFGEPGDVDNLVYINFPYRMVLAWDKNKKVTRTRVHKKVAGPMLAALTELVDTYGEEWIQTHNLHLFGGVFNNRSVRGGKTTSTHAWGAAIDLNPDENRNQQPWTPDKIGQVGFGNMPIEAVRIFEKHGFKHGGRAWGRDAMHFQYTK